MEKGKRLYSPRIKNKLIQNLTTILDALVPRLPE